MNNRTKCHVQTALRALLPLLGAICVSGCSGAESGATDGDSSPGNLDGTQENAGVTLSTPGTRVSLTPSSGTAPTPPPNVGPALAPSAGVGFSAKVLAANGSGCPQGSATITATTADSLTLSFPGYGAKRGGAASIAETRRNCVLVLDVSVPAGYTYALTSASLSGSANLAAGTTGRAITSYYFAGSADDAVTTQALASGQWSTPGTFDSAVYAPCNAQRFLSVNTSVVLSGANTAESSISVDPSTTLKLSLHQCQ